MPVFISSLAGSSDGGGCGRLLDAWKSASQGSDDACGGGRSVKGVKAFGYALNVSVYACGYVHGMRSDESVKLS